MTNIQQYTLEQTSAPATEPITVAEAKTYAWVTEATDDTLIGELITEVRELMEELTGIVLVTSTYKQYLDTVPDREILLLRMPLASVSSITYVDINGATQTWASADYQVDAKSKPPRVCPAYGESWPSTRQQYNAITITYTAGFGAAAAVPHRFKKRLAKGVKYRYDHRDESDEEWLKTFLSQGWHGWMF